MAQVETIQAPRRTPAPSAIDQALARLDAWLDTMRGPGGYGGPVAHWWQQSLLYTGAGHDWRYEGIIAGYLLLWQRTADARWLAKACRAGDDLVGAQLASGHFAASGFEDNISSAGTPHEAACDLGLLLLAQALRDGPHPPARLPAVAGEGERGHQAFAVAGEGEQAYCPSDWQRYAACAERNLRALYIEQLWDAEAQSFRDSPGVPSFVPNKAATACEALFVLAELSGDETWVTRYALPNLRRILDHQVRRGSRLAGAIAQNSFGARVVEKYFPIYIARCVPALLRAQRWTNEDRFADAAIAALSFVARWGYDDGSFPTAVYANMRANRYPSWVAPLGDILRAGDLLRPYGLALDLGATTQRLLDGQDASGGIQTARGFAAQAGGRLPRLPDLRDLLHVAGWCDKAFRALAAHAGPALPAARSESFQARCTFQQQTFLLQETPSALTAADERNTCVYSWRKGEPWAHAPHPAFWLR